MKAGMKDVLLLLSTCSAAAAVLGPLSLQQSAKVCQWICCPLALAFTATLASFMVFK